MKLSVANMLDLFMNELETVKKDLYLDFGETQKLIASDINHLRSENNQFNIRIDILEKERKNQRGVVGDASRGSASHALEGRVDQLEKMIMRLDPAAFQTNDSKSRINLGANR